jgi:hypothetical protein
MAKSLARRVSEQEGAPAHAQSDEEEEEGVHNNPAILASPHVPEPVFFCSVEAPSLSQQKQFELALACLAREDPSLRVKQVNGCQCCGSEIIRMFWLDPNLKKKFGLGYRFGFRHCCRMKICVKNQTLGREKSYDFLLKFFFL